MILTVTPNTALDKILFIDEWVTGTPMRTKKIVTSVGGKGLDSSVVLRHLGVETVGLCFVAGKTGKELIEVVKGYGIIPEPVWVNGETRIAHVISEIKHHRHSHIIAGELRVTKEQCDKLFQIFDKYVREADWVICAGSVPSTISPDLYLKITQSAKHAGVPILIDSFGTFITETLPEIPNIIKMNNDEFTLTFRQEGGDMSAIKKQALKVFNDYKLKALVLTCAADGILAISSEGAFHAVAPKQKAVNAAGAGDAVSSALVWRLSKGDQWPDALRWAAATSAAVVLTEGTADCHMDDIKDIYPNVTIQQF